MPSLDFDLEEARFQAFYDQQLPELERACATFVAMLSAIVKQARFIEASKVEGRVKDRDECIRKFSRKYRPALEASGTPYEIRPYITDLIGVRVVCLYEDELDRVAEAVRSHFDVMDVTDKVAALEEILFRYEAPALADAANGALRRDAEH